MSQRMTLSVESLMDTPPGRDEFGPPDEAIERCQAPCCDILFGRGSWHRCEQTEARLEWVEYQVREALR
jgi:hypothetical protein